MEYLTVEEIKTWLDNNVTRDFMARIKLREADSDKLVHKCLEINEPKDAAFHNAGKVMCTELLEEPERMIEDAKEGVDGEDNA